MESGRWRDGGEAGEFEMGAGEGWEGLADFFKFKDSLNQLCIYNLEEILSVLLLEDSDTK